MREQPQTAPFHWMWEAQGSQVTALQGTYHSVVVPPVDLTSLAPIPDGASELGTYFHGKITDGLKSDGSLGLQMAEAPGPDIFVVQAAILELEATKAVLNAVTSVAGFFIPGAKLLATAISTGAGAAEGEVAKGSCAIGVQLRDGGTNEVLIEAADFREDSSALLFDAEGFSEYAHTKDSMDRWAKGIPWLFNRNAKVDKQSSVSLVTLW